MPYSKEVFLQMQYFVYHICSVLLCEFHIVKRKCKKIKINKNNKSSQFFHHSENVKNSPCVLSARPTFSVCHSENQSRNVTS